jgi:Pyruvate/2-oxoacid:ferredoxin oxidoreductase delta subunit
VPTASEPARPGGFSLEAFYAAREQSGEGRTGGGLPTFSLREGLAVPQDGVSRIGMTVRVRPQLCLAWQGSFCSTCSERCPVEGAIAVELGRPRVVESQCNGCGLCVQVCPAPLNGFEFVPSRAEVAP